jgi:hypothetical protein
MEPGLRPGQRVCVLAQPVSARPGDVVVLRSGARRPDEPRFVVHRLVLLAQVGPRLLLFHRGDARGRQGLTDATALAGRVSGVLERDGSLRALAPPNRAARWRWRAACLRCRVYVAARRLAWRCGLRTPLPAGVQRWTRRLLG